MSPMDRVQVRKLVDRWNRFNYRLADPRWTDEHKGKMAYEMQRLEVRIGAYGVGWKFIGRNKSMILVER